MEKKLLKY